MGDWLMYQIIIRKKAKKFIDKLPKNEKIRIVSAIMQLPNGEDIKKLKGHSDLLRLRVGSYRIIYTIDNGQCIIIVIDAGNRGEIYGSVVKWSAPIYWGTMVRHSRINYTPYYNSRFTENAPALTPSAVTDHRPLPGKSVRLQNGCGIMW